MILTIGLWNRSVSGYKSLLLSSLTTLQIPLPRALLNLLIVYLSNFAGCLVMAYIFSYQTDIFQAEPYLSYVQELAFTKTRAHPWWVIFLKAIPANTLVCMAVMLGFAARDGAGKVRLCMVLRTFSQPRLPRYWRFGSR
jgi:formate/nitrite transporter FocA (FNT family)